MRLDGGGLAVNDIAFSPDGKTLAVCYDPDTPVPGGGYSATRDDNLRLFDVATGRLKQTRAIQGGPGYPAAISFSPDGGQIAGSAPFGIDVLTLAGNAPAVSTPGEPYREKDGAMTVAWTHQWNGGQPFFGPNHTLIAYGTPVEDSDTSKFVCTIWSVATAKLLSHQAISPGPNTDIEAIQPAPDGKRVAVIFSRTHMTGNLVEVDSSGEGILFDGETGRPLVHLPPLGNWELDGIQTAFSSDEKYLAVEDREGHCLIRDAHTGTVMRMMTGLRSKAPTSPSGESYLTRTDGLSILTFSPDDRLLAAGRQDGKVKLYSMATGLPVQVWQDVETPIKQILFSPDGRTLAASDSMGTIHLWKVAAS